MESSARRIRIVAVALALTVLPGCAIFGYPSPSAPSATDPAAEPPTGGESYEVFGHRYRVLATARGYREVGIASWYGPGFHDRPTSSGERFDQNAMTAAHRTLPFGTRVEVTNLDNGRTVVVRVNDRGPFADPDRRIIDLSHGAARELGMVGDGTARVEVRALTGG